MARRSFLGLAAAALARAQEPMVQTVLGSLPASALGATLMHEHIVADLRSPADRDVADYDREEAIRIAAPQLEALVAAGCRTLVEITPIHIGRDVEALRRLSERTGLQIIAATGIYGAANQSFIPDYARTQSVDELAERYVREFESGVGPNRVKPGILKTGVNRQTPLPDIERKLVRAAALAARQTGLALASHTGPAAPAVEELDILEEVGLPPDRFIWVHAQAERDQEAHRRIARRGAWVEFDGVSPRSADWHLSCIRAMAEAGLLDRTLISQDAGWYRPGEPGGGDYRSHVYLFEAFLPKLRKAGFTQTEVDRLIVENPRRALPIAVPQRS